MASSSSENPILSALKVTVSKADLDAWGTNTVFGVFAGMLYGGCKEAMVFSDKEETLLAQQKLELNPRQRRNILRLVMEEKVLRVARGTVVGGAKLGLFTAVFCAVEQYLAKRRSTHDTLNVVAAGSATAATLGLLSPGSFAWRMQSAFLGSVVGATLGVPLGFAWSFVNQQLDEQLETSKVSDAVRKEREAPYDAVGDAIQRLEERVSSQK